MARRALCVRPSRRLTDTPVIKLGLNSRTGMVEFPYAHMIGDSHTGFVANKPNIRSSMLVDWPNSIITGGYSDQIQSVQMATLSIRDHPSLRSLVFTLRPQLSRPRRNDAGTRSFG